MGLQKKGDNKTITVSAKITQLGKHILMTDPAAFQITKFALADDEIDYRLWNINHDNGSNYFAIASTVSVPADASIVVIGKDNSIYLDETDLLAVTASANSDLVACVSYELMKDA